MTPKHIRASTHLHAHTYTRTHTRQAQASRMRPSSAAPVVWEDEMSRDGGVKRALDHLLETSTHPPPSTLCKMSDCSPCVELPTLVHTPGVLVLALGDAGWRLGTLAAVLTHASMRAHTGAVSSGDWAKYEKLCDKNMTCFEPETVGYVAKGLNFHKFYFDLPSSAPAVKPNVTLADVHVRMLTGGSLPPAARVCVCVCVCVVCVSISVCACARRKTAADGCAGCLSMLAVAAV